MAVTLPNIEIRFKQLAGSLVERSARGIAVLIVKDDTDESFDYREYKDATEVKSKEFTGQNMEYIKDVLAYRVNKCVVVRIGTIDGKLTDALSIISKNVKTGWITIANGTEQEFTDLASWIKARELERKTYKAVVYQVEVTDCKHLVNFYNDKVIFMGDRGEKTGEKYCPSLIGILASCNIQRGSTYFNCDNLTRVEEVDNNEAAVGSGKFILINDNDNTVKIAAGINSMTTTDGIDNTEDMKYIETVEAMDMISDDISNVFKTEYLGKYKNNYDNQVLLISAVNTYFKQLADDYVLDNNYNNKADVDVSSQRDAWVGVGKQEAADWDEQTVKNNAFKRTVFLTGNIKILGAIENLKFIVNLF